MHTRGKIDSLTKAIFTQDILDEADTDKNGLIDYAEFANMMEPGRRFDGLQWYRLYHTAYSFNASSIPLSRGGGVKNKSEDECAPSQSLWHWFKEGYQDALVCKD